MNAVAIASIIAKVPVNTRGSAPKHVAKLPLPSSIMIV
ncbi:hypothetical protein GGGNBK_08995 [Sporosarcina sp. ANT_H38]